VDVPSCVKPIEWTTNLSVWEGFDHSQYQVGHRLREKGGFQAESALSGGQLVTYLNWTFHCSSSREDVIESKTFRAKPISILSISIPFHQRHSHPAFEDGNCDQNRQILKSIEFKGWCFLEGGVRSLKKLRSD
jgi:hypothetical protein